MELTIWLFGREVLSVTAHRDQPELTSRFEVGHTGECAIDHFDLDPPEEDLIDDGVDVYAFGF